MIRTVSGVTGAMTCVLRLMWRMRAVSCAVIGMAGALCSFVTFAVIGVAGTVILVCRVPL